MKEQLFMLEDGTDFVWQGVAYTLLKCDDAYAARVKNLRSGSEENFNGCALVEVSTT